jgi:hypothetical protein
MKERKVVGGIFCNLQKANHNILLIKLEFYGVAGTILTLIKSYLEHRYQKVILGNNLPNFNSDWREITLNDYAEVVLYADDNHNYY